MSILLFLGVLYLWGKRRW